MNDSREREREKKNNNKFNQSFFYFYLHFLCKFNFSNSLLPVILKLNWFVNEQSTNVYNLHCANNKFFFLSFEISNIQPLI